MGRTFSGASFVLPCQPIPCKYRYKWNPLCSQFRSVLCILDWVTSTIIVEPKHNIISTKILNQVRSKHPECNKIEKCFTSLFHDISSGASFSPPGGPGIGFLFSANALRISTAFQLAYFCFSWIYTELYQHTRKSKLNTAARTMTGHIVFKYSEYKFPQISVMKMIYDKIQKHE